MKILRLDLLAYGPFTDVSLDLSGGDEGLHIVYGPNEAGKSSTLRALRALLFGVPHNTADNHVHAHGDLRIGALLRYGACESLEIVRRKGNKNTLLAADGAVPIDAALLSKALGGLDEPTFATRFGIDHAELVKGGQAINAADGDLGQMLFAASAGIAHLGRVQAELAQEAGAFFKRAGKQQRINGALDQLKDARKLVRETHLSDVEWRRREEAVQAAGAEYERIVGQWSEAAKQKGRLERIRAGGALVGQRTAVLARLAELGGGPFLPASFSQRRRETEQALKTAQRDREATTAAIERISASLAEIADPSPILAHDEAIGRALEQASVCRKAAKDRIGLTAAHERASADIQAAMTRIGVAMAEGPPSLRTAERTRIRELAEEHADLTRDFSAARQLREKTESEANRVQTQLAAAARTTPTTDLARAVERAMTVAGQEESIAAQRDALSSARMQLELALARLPFWSGILDELERLALPPAEACDAIEERLGAADNSLEHARKMSAKAAVDEKRALAQLTQFAAQGEVPSVEQLAAARRRRDDAWSVLHNRLLAGEAVISTECEAYEALVVAADELSDRLRREADSVARKEQLKRDVDERGRDCEARRGELQAAEASLAAAQAAWFALWQGAGVEPRTPREMRSWRTQQERICREAAELRHRESAAAVAKEKIREACEALTKAMRQFSNELPAADGPLADRIETAKSALAEADVAARRRMRLEEDAQRLAYEVAAASEACDALENRLAKWRVAWAAAIVPLGHGDQLSPRQALDVLRELEEMQVSLVKSQDLAARIEAIDRDAAALVADFAMLRADAAFDWSEADLAAITSGDVERMAAVWSARLGAARKAADRRDDLVEQLNRQQEQLAHVERAARHAQAALEMLCGEAGAASADELPELEHRSDERRELQVRLRGIEDGLHAQTAGASLDAFAAEVNAADFDSLPAEIHRLEQEIDALASKQAQAHAHFILARQSKESASGQMAGAAALAEVESLRAQIADDAASFARLRLASAVLRRAIERYRAKNQAPLLARGSELFAELTCGRFERLEVDYDDDKPVLAGVRAGGKKKVRAAGMSDGTRDQLYLALRLASVEQYVAGHEPVPFVVDDILQRFDDRRGAAALVALAALARHTQVVFFTHHEHVLQLAAEHLGDGEYFVQRLDSTALQAV